MNTTIRYALVAVVLIAAGSVAMVLAYDSDASALMPRATPAAAIPTALEASAPAAAPAPAPTAIAPARVTAPVREQEQDHFKSWSPTVAHLPGDLGEFGPSLKFGLDEARNNDMAFCFRDVDQSGRGALATDFILYLEAREDAVDVVDVKVARPGNLPPSVRECCRDVLRGLEVKVFFSVPGQRFSYSYEVEA